MGDIVASQATKRGAANAMMMSQMDLPKEKVAKFGASRTTRVITTTSNAPVLDACHSRK